MTCAPCQLKKYNEAKALRLIRLHTGIGLQEAPA